MLPGYVYSTFCVCVLSVSSSVTLCLLALGRIFVVEENRVAKAPLVYCCYHVCGWLPSSIGRQ